MGRMARSCIRSLLKLVNSLIGMIGIGIILYALWMFRVWHRHMDGPSPAPWFIYTFLGLGVTLCVVTCSGHIAAETANGCCLYFYMVFVFLLFTLEAAVTVDVFLNRNWEEGLCMLFAMILKALGPRDERCYESDDDYDPDRVPLLKSYARQPPYVVVDPLYGSRNGSTVKVEMG
ncbi:hypothetical protein RJ640_008675 [Escallonia rubra]|uniref:Tetraspanin-19 n=1 Tax=Escallonia rubra TaxID=112253 RepID=A0AA88URY1_9ASTE|nr:hypothetical protein RJ640_008675 [Escallonia rubra]